MNLDPKVVAHQLTTIIKSAIVPLQRRVLALEAENHALRVRLELLEGAVAAPDPADTIAPS